MCPEREPRAGTTSKRHWNLLPGIVCWVENRQRPLVLPLDAEELLTKNSMSRDHYTAIPKLTPGMAICIIHVNVTGVTNCEARTATHDVHLAFKATPKATPSRPAKAPDQRPFILFWVINFDT
uniref:Uncharacterized protein n=1 Tax=Triticum urartu TaxID=4572 RepID=A0A8R7V9A5_TRIUA